MDLIFSIQWVGASRNSSVAPLSGDAIYNCEQTFIQKIRRNAPADFAERMGSKTLLTRTTIVQHRSEYAEQPYTYHLRLTTGAGA